MLENWLREICETLKDFLWLVSLYKNYCIDLIKHSYNSWTLRKLLWLRKRQLHEIRTVLENGSICVSTGEQACCIVKWWLPRAAGKARSFCQNNKTIPNIPASQKCSAGTLMPPDPRTAPLMNVWWMSGVRIWQLWLTDGRCISVLGELVSREVDQWAEVSNKVWSELRLSRQRSETLIGCAVHLPGEQWKN